MSVVWSVEPFYSNNLFKYNHLELQYTVSQKKPSPQTFGSNWQILTDFKNSSLTYSAGNLQYSPM